SRLRRSHGLPSLPHQRQSHWVSLHAPSCYYRIELIGKQYHKKEQIQPEQQEGCLYCRGHGDLGVCILPVDGHNRSHAVCKDCFHRFNDAVLYGKYHDLHPPLPEQFREQRADAVQRGDDNDARDNRYVRNIIKEGIFVFPHDLLVVEEDDQKYQCSRQKGDSNDLDKERDKYQGSSWDKDNGTCGHQREEVEEVEPDGLFYLVV